ncbi:purine-nucleoside phosphorylase [Gorillibacterium massiliense]|uniref:purine-nucleoside phosphorylase n=1 Tax=Gorillibacterium massiliense TaxID=1280390 RepID=UPI0004BB960F|nr:purine-nucleoside phosphorylase [Gorillibacterium massiliense]
MEKVSLLERIDQAAAAIAARSGETPEIGLILGSGLGILADLIEDAVVVPYHEIPFFPVSTVEGHAGELLLGKVKGRQVLMMKGRFHTYEGYEPDAVSFPVRVMKKLGVKTLLVTNAAGGVNESFDVGDLMVISDHLNFMFRNPLIGPNDNSLGVRFPDMSEAYSKRLRKLAHETAAELGFSLREGVYAAMSGPAYETPAEIRMLRIVGSDAVGMSTVPEVMVARHAGIEVLGFSCISNMAAGILDQPLSHAEVMEAADRVKDKFLGLILAILPKI